MIIVTGGAGFIGSAIVWKLNKSGINDIIIVDKFGRENNSTDNFSTDEKYKNLIHLDFIDLFDRDEFLEMIKSDFLKKNKVCVIFHMGACSSTTEYNFNLLLKNNYDYSKILCSNAISNNIRFIYASSAATYGDGKSGYSDEEDKLHYLFPLNPYGYSKHLFDLWAKRNGYLKKIAGLKFFNVFGPNEYHKKDMRSVANKCFHQIKQTGKARLFRTTSSLYADGEQKRDFIYIKDVIDMTMFFYENNNINGIYNIGSGKANSFNAVVKPIFKSLGLKENIEYFDMPETLVDKYQDYTQADISKIRKAGFDKPTTDISDAIEDYIKNYLNTEDIYLK